MKKKPLLLVSLFLIILSFTTLHSFAEPTHVYKNVQTDTTYWNLDTALSNATNGQTIELLDTVTLTNPISVTGKAITIDLNGNDMIIKYSKPTPIPASVISKDGAHLIFNNSSTTEGALTLETTAGNYGLYAETRGVIDFLGDIILVDGPYDTNEGYGAYAIGEGSTINITGDVEASNICIYSLYGGSVNVIGNVSGSIGVDASNNSTVRVEGDLTTSSYPIYAANSSEVVIDGNVFYDQRTSGIRVYNDSSVEVTGEYKSDNFMKYLHLKFSTEEFYFNEFSSITDDGYLVYSNNNSTVYIKNNWLCYIGVDNQSIPYTSLQDAFAEAENNETINVIKHINSDGPIELSDKNIVIETNDYDINIDGSTSSVSLLKMLNSSISVTGEGDLNLTISHQDISRALEADNSAVTINNINSSLSESSAVGVYATNSSNITIDGNIESYYYGVQSFGSIVNVKGDIISDSPMSTGVEAHSSSDVTIEKNIETKVGARLYDDDTLVTVNGLVLSDEFAYIDALEVLDSDITKSGGYDVYRKSHLTASLRVRSPYWGVEIDSDNYYPFEGGNGLSLEGAYEISTANQLAQLSYNVRNNIDLYTEKFFVLTNDIDLSGKEWMPIGYRNYSEREEYGFNGYFDGDGYTISNLTIGYSDARSELDQIGLFGAIKYAAEIKNTYMGDVVIYAHNSDSIGALVGYSESRGAITNCSVTGFINSTGTNGSVGGIVGKTYNMQADNLRSDIDIRLERVNSVGGVIGYFGAHSYDVLKLLKHSIYSGNIYINGYASAGAGGIVGHSYGYALILNSINNGSIELDTSSGQGNLGGIAGKIHNEVANCYSTGGISAYNGNIGGIVGFADHGGNIYNSYSSGYTISSGSKAENFGGIVGYANSNVEFVNCYFNTQKNSSLPLVSETNDNVSINNCYGLTTAEMQGNVLNAPIYYTDNLAVSGKNGFTNALNIWIETQEAFQDLNFSEWERLDAFNNKYPFLVKTTEKDPLHNSKVESILVDSSSLNPSFNSDNYEYTVSVEENVESINISVNPASPRSTVLIDQTQTDSKNIPLETSATTISIKLTSDSNVFSTEYSIVINKAKKISSPASKPSPPVIIVITETKDGKVTNSTDIKPSVVNKRISSFITPAILDKLIETAKETNGTNSEDNLILQYLDNTGIDEQRIAMQRNGLIKITQETYSNLIIHSNMLEMIFSKEIITNITDQLKDRNVIFNVSSNDTDMKDEVVEKYKDRPKYKITIKGENEAIKELSNGKALVTFPYMLKKDEHPYAVVIKHIDEDGNEEIIKGIYNQDNRSITASIDKLGTYVIDHKLVEFEDVGEDNQYKDAIVFSAARQITSGTGNNQYSPKAKLTRGQFIVMIMDAYNIKNLEELTINNFLDAGETYYTPYLHTARQLGLVNGVGNDLYLPNNEISTQEALAMLSNIFRIRNEMFLEDDSKSGDDIKDLDTISSWARNSVLALYKYNIALENDGYLNAKKELLREEYAQIIYNILSK